MVPGAMRMALARLRDPRVLLGLIIVIGLGLRFVDAGTRLSHDEGYSWLVASAGSAHSFLARLARYENTPPLFYLLLSPLPLDSEVWLRLPSIIAGVAMIPVLYAIVRPLLWHRGCAAIGAWPGGRAVRGVVFGLLARVHGRGPRHPACVVSCAAPRHGRVATFGRCTGWRRCGRCTPSITPRCT